ncbi:unnamed protein product [Protopolystoma xenopodis]|uniref:Uncharacterized protein n=1 Tax=Protopolystoma xenopodis TaxID=117903 RepID=A0A448X999_9PLAT|nr:unnamed protein product [Protopolystoma xenopodis]
MRQFVVALATGTAYRGAMATGRPGSHLRLEVMPPGTAQPGPVTKVPSRHTILLQSQLNAPLDGMAQFRQHNEALNKCSVCAPFCGCF